MEINLTLKGLEPAAARAMYESLSSVLSTAVSNPFLQSFARALNLALNQKIDPANPPVVDGKLETLSDKQLGEVFNSFHLFVMTFGLLGFTRATKFCSDVREIASAEVLARLSRRNPPGRFFPDWN